MKVYKVVLKNENVIYPKCHNCGKELSPYLIENPDYEVLEAIKEANLLLGYSNNNPIALICKECCKVTKNEKIG